MAKLKTIYQIRAEIPAHVVEESGLLSKAREIGLHLKADDAGNVEGAWDASLLTLAEALRTLHAAGVKHHLIQMRIVAMVVAVEAPRTNKLIGALRQGGISEFSRAEDVLTGEAIFRFTVSCEIAGALVKRIRKLDITKIVATESYEIVSTTSN